MRNPKVKNKYNLTFSDIKKLKIKDRSKLREPLFLEEQCCESLVHF